MARCSMKVGGLLIGLMCLVASASSEPTGLKEMGATADELQDLYTMDPLIGEANTDTQAFNPLSSASTAFPPGLDLQLKDTQERLDDMGAGAGEDAISEAVGSGLLRSASGSEQKPVYIGMGHSPQGNPMASMRFQQLQDLTQMNAKRSHRSGGQTDGLLAPLPKLPEEPSPVDVLDNAVAMLLRTKASVRIPSIDSTLARESQQRQQALADARQEAIARDGERSSSADPNKGLSAWSPASTEPRGFVTSGADVVSRDVTTEDNGVMRASNVEVDTHDPTPTKSEIEPQLIPTSKYEAEAKATDGGEVFASHSNSHPTHRTHQSNTDTSSNTGASSALRQTNARSAGSKGVGSSSQERFKEKRETGVSSKTLQKLLTQLGAAKSQVSLLNRLKQRTTSAKHTDATPGDATREDVIASLNQATSEVHALVTALKSERQKEALLEHEKDEALAGTREAADQIQRLTLALQQQQQQQQTGSVQSLKAQIQRLREVDSHKMREAADVINKLLQHQESQPQISLLQESHLTAPADDGYSPVRQIPTPASAPPAPQPLVPAAGVDAPLNGPLQPAVVSDDVTFGDAESADRPNDENAQAKPAATSTAATTSSAESDCSCHPHPECPCSKQTANGDTATGSTTGKILIRLTPLWSETPEEDKRRLTSLQEKGCEIVRKIEESERNLDSATTQEAVQRALLSHLQYSREGLLLLRNISYVNKRVWAHIRGIGQSKVKKPTTLQRDLSTLVQSLKTSTHRAMSVVIGANQQRLQRDIARAYAVVANLETLGKEATNENTKRELVQQVRKAMRRLEELRTAELRADQGRMDTESGDVSALAAEANRLVSAFAEGGKTVSHSEDARHTTEKSRPDIVTADTNGNDLACTGCECSFSCVDGQDQSPYK